MLRSNKSRRPSLPVARLHELSGRVHVVAVAAVVTCVLLAGCGGDAGSAGASAAGPSTPAGSDDLDRVVSIEGSRGLYVRCTGSGSPTVDHGGRRRRHEQFVRVCRAEHREGDAYVRLRPGQPRSERSRSRPAGSATELVGDLEPAARCRADPRAIRSRGDLRRWVHHGGLRRRPSKAGRGHGLRRHRRVHSGIRLARSSRRRIRATPITSNVVTTCRWRRTRGQPADRSVTSLWRS